MLQVFMYWWSELAQGENRNKTMCLLDIRSVKDVLASMRTEFGPNVQRSSQVLQIAQRFGECT